MDHRLDSEFPPGTRMGHFEIRELIGIGGMGVVFKARDVRLGRAVALKVLSRDLFDDEGARKRFLREAQLASTLSHPNVATIYEIDEERSTAFIAMELVDGKDLKHVLASSGTLPLDDVLKIGVQACDALTAAHKAGIVHRDVKASNIMVTPAGDVKVLDFGLAKGIDSALIEERNILEDPTPPVDESTACEIRGNAPLLYTKHGVIVGTPSYMSPEQASGRTVDNRSDIFSLGIVLYEAVTGELPFRGHSEKEILAAVRSLDPTPVHASRPDVPSRFSEVVSKCLAKHPEKRFQSATEVRAALESVAHRDGSRSWTDGTIWARVKSRRAWAAGLTAGVLLLLSLVMVVDRSSRVAFEERDWVLIADFENLTEDPMLGDALGAALRIGLEQSPYANVYPQRDVTEALKRMRRNPGEPITRELGGELSVREGIRALLLGQVVQIGSRFTLSVEVVEPSTLRTIRLESTTVEGREALVGGIESLSTTIRRELGESLSSLKKASQPLERVTSGSIDALYAFSQGMNEMASANDAEAVKFFERAVELDPEFAMAHARAGLVYYTTDISHSRALAHWREALAHVDRLTEYEKLYVQASQARFTDPPEALRLWSLMRSIYPSSVVGHHNAAVSFWYFNNDFARAADGFAAAAATAVPRSFVSLTNLGYMELGMGRFSRAVESFAEARRRSSNPLYSGMADALVAMKDYDAAFAVLDEGERSSIVFSVMEARIRRAALHLDRGELSEAKRIYEENLIRSAGLSSTRWSVASRLALDACLEREGGGARLRESLRQNLDRLVEAMRAGEEPDYTAGLQLGLATKIWLRNFGVPGTEAATRALGERAEGIDFAPWKAYVTMLQAEAALAEGAPARSETDLLRALATVDLFQLHETLARIYRAQGKREQALGECRWILAHRGQVFAESSGAWSARELSLLDWALAHVHAASLSEELGRADEARALYREFLEHWRLGDAGLPELEEARRRLR
jgi:putative peptide modification system cyclase